MSEKPNITVVLKHATHKRGEPYPQIDFSTVQKYNITNKQRFIACSNEDIKNQIDERLQNTTDDEVPYFFYYVLEGTPLTGYFPNLNINVDTGENDDGFGTKWKEHAVRIAKAAKGRKDNPIMLKKDVDLQQLMKENVEYTDPVAYMQKYVNQLYDNYDIDEKQNILGKKQK